jgi:hypothetical protein
LVAKRIEERAPGVPVGYVLSAIRLTGFGCFATILEQ